MVTIKVYGVSGRLVKTLSDEVYGFGRHSVAWTGEDAQGIEVGAGIYFVRLEADTFVDARKMLLIE